MRDDLRIRAGTPGTKAQAPTQPPTTVGEMARDLGVDFRPESLQLSCVRLARLVESQKFRLALVERELHEARMPWWQRVIRRWRSR